MASTSVQMTQPWQCSLGCLVSELMPSFLPSVPWALYCITPALDGYIMLSDRTPRTQMMMSPNICGMVLCILWHPHPSSTAAYLHPPILLPSGLLLSKVITCRQTMPSADPHEAWLSSTDLATSAWPVALISVEEMWRNAVEETNSRVSKGDKVPLVEKCI